MGTLKHRFANNHRLRFVHQVKWDYSILLMHSIVGSFVIHFADSDTLRNCASHMDIILRRVKKASNVNSNYNEKPVVAVETPTQLKHQWERWLREHTGELVSCQEKKQNSL